MPHGLRSTMLAAALVAALSPPAFAIPTTDRATALSELQSVLQQYQATKAQLGGLPQTDEITLALQPLLDAEEQQQQQDALRLAILLSDLRADAPSQSELAELLAQAQQRLDAFLAALPPEACTPGTPGCVPTPTPEPGTLALVASALAALAWRRQRRSER